MPVALLNRNREFLLGFGLELAHLRLLVIGEIFEPLRLFQLL